MDFEFGNWQLQCLPEDGARLSRLRYAGYDLLTQSPDAFLPPTAGYGQYETRPIYGCDDCFPTVSACPFPLPNYRDAPDHGELCWLPWQVTRNKTQLDCIVKSQLLPVTFKRTLQFDAQALNWTFEVAEHLLRQPPGTANLYLLRDCTEGKVRLRFKSGLALDIKFPVQLFPTLGIWWNNGGYPDEDGCRRTECAFEPIPGSCNHLSNAYRDGQTLIVAPYSKLNWTINWQIKNSLTRY